MAFSRVFCGFLASLMIVFTAHTASAAGYQCTKKYTSCNGLYYPNTSGRCIACGTNTTDTRSCSITCNIDNASSVSTTNGTQTCNGPYKSGGTSCTGCADNAWGECKNATCKAAACNENYYLSNGACNACPERSTSSANNTNDYCNCKPGWYRNTNIYPSRTSGDIGCDVIQVTLDKNGGTGGTDFIYSQAITTINVNTPPKFHTTPFVSSTNNTTITAPTKNYYTFDGYYTEGGTQKLENDMVAHYRPQYSYTNMFLSSPTTWYAHWTPNTYRVTLDNRGADIAAGTTEYYYQYETKGKCYYYTDSTLQTCIAGPDGVNITIPQKTGYTFGGYFTGTNGTGTQYVDGSGLTVENLYKKIHDNVTLYAKWTPKTYTITLDKDGGNGGTDKIKEVYATRWTYENNNSIYGTIGLPTKDGFTFNGYWTAKGTGGKQIVNNYGSMISTIDALSTFNDSNTSDGNGTLYAQWTPNEYEITFNTNCPSTTSTSGNTTANFVLTLVYDTRWKDSGNSNKTSVAVPTCPGYTFNGYYKTATGGDVILNRFEGGLSGLVDLSANKTFTTSNTTLYAQWTANQFTINYDLNKPTTDNGYVTNASAEPNRNGGLPTRIQTYDGTYVAPTNPTLTGWMFQGWGRKANNATESAITSDDFKILLTQDGAETTVYAIWQPIEFKVQYNANKPEIASGNVGNMPENITCTYDMDCNLSGTPTLTGWTFDGWYTTSDNANDPVTNMNNATTTNGATVNVYAKWTANTYTITFDQTGGTGGTEKRDVIYDNTVKSITTPMKPGHTFAGYYADGIKYFDEYGNYAILNVDNQWRHADNITLFATWTICPANSYCPGNTSLEKYSCADLERVPTQLDDESVEKPRIGYWSGSDEGAINATDCYRVCKQDRSPIIDNPAISNGHGILMCVTGQTNNAGECIANHAQSCTYNAVCDDGYEEVYRGTERAYCKPRGYNVTFDNNGGVGLVTLDECTVGTNCVLPGVTVDGTPVLTRTGYVFTGWSLSSDGSTGILPAGTDLLGELNPTGSLTFYAIWGECDYGYYWNGLGGSYGECVACPLHSYKDTISIAYGDKPQSCTKCDAGWYTTGTATTSLPGVDDGCIMCPAGSYCPYQEGPQPCPEYTTDDPHYNLISEKLSITNLVYNSNLGASAQNNCYFKCPKIDIAYGEVTQIVNETFNYDPDLPISEQICKYTCVSVTGNPGHVVNGRCKEDSCNPEYEMKNGICTECDRPNAMSYRAGGNCVIDACVDGYHPDDLRKTCVLNEEDCTIANAAVAKKIWDPTNGTMGTCKPIECEYGYHIDGNLCVSDTRDCTVDNGTGQMEWDTVHNRWGACQVTTCKPGYTNDPYESNEPTKQCGECRNKYGIDSKVSGVGTRAVAGYKTGCEIASCEFQGELYNLEGNECVPICNITRYSDETGYMEWNPGTRKCVRTCYTDKGYVSWDEPLRPGN